MCSCVCSQLIQILPIEKVLAAFGPPQGLNSDALQAAAAAGIIESVDAADASFGEWFLSLQPLHPDPLPPAADSTDADSLSGRAGDGVGVSVGDSITTDDTLHFMLRANGEDLDSITALAAFCIFNAVVHQPESYAIRPPLERMVHCDVLHHASMTENLVAYLERVLDGVHFMAHYDLPDCIADEDDAEMLYLSRRSTQHPICSGRGSGSSGGVFSNPSTPPPQDDAMASKGSRKSLNGSEGENSNAAGEGSKDPMGAVGAGASSAPLSCPSSSFKPGNGALLGIDVDIISKLLVPASECSLDREEEYSRNYSSYDISGFVRPVSERLKFFAAADKDDFNEALWLFNILSLYAQQMYAIQLENDDDGVLGGGLSGGGFGGTGMDGFESDLEQESLVIDPHSPHTPHPSRSVNTAKLNAHYANAKVKIVDLGNACWTYKRFTDDIQTRQYRAPEVLVGSRYDTSADMWSLACVAFELLTGDLLFDPQAGKSWSREEDHLALIMELMGDFPKSLQASGKYASEYFNKKGELRHIHQLNFWGLRDVLTQKYKFGDDDAEEVADFLERVLEVRS